MTTIEAPATREMPYVSAVNEAVAQLMREDPDIFIAGEDVAFYGSVFGVSRGLLKEFGPQRVVDTPISESGLMGLGLGAAATGLRPIIDIMFMDFMGVCMDEVVNQIAKMKYMFGGTAKLPITIHTIAGAGTRMAAQHSQSLEAWLCHIPGLKVVMPSGPYEAKGLMVAAVRDDIALIVAVLMDETFVAARAIWNPARLRTVVLARAEPSAVGISAIGGLLHPVPETADIGLLVEVGEGRDAVIAPIAPGLYSSVPVREVRELAMGEVVEVTGPGMLGLDGERERRLRPGMVAPLSVRRDGPRVVDVPLVMKLAACRGLFRVTQGEAIDGD